MQTSFTEGRRTGEFIKSEGFGSISRDVVTIESGQSDLSPGTVLGCRTVGNAVTATAGTNTGNGTVGSITTGADVEIGTYQLVATAATKFDLFTPKGDKLKTVTVGTAFASSHLGLAITAGGTAFVAGDSFSLVVAAGSGKYVALDPTADDGSQIASGILYAAADASTADAKAVAITRLSEVDGDRLIWPAGITTNQKTAAVADMARAFIIVR